MVCSKHSSKRILLPNIHKTQPQRVCDSCSVVLEERNSIRLSGSLRLEPSATPTKIEEVSSSDQRDQGGDEEEEENSRETYLSRRFSMKTFRGWNPAALPPPKNSTPPSPSAKNTTPPPAPPRAVDSPSVVDSKRKEEILSQLLSQKIQDDDDLLSRPLVPSSSSLQSEVPPSSTTTTSRHKIIPAYSVPISFMLTHDSVKSRKSLLISHESHEVPEGGKGIELSTFSTESSRGQSQDLRPSLSMGRPSFLRSTLSSRSLGDGERGSSKSLHDTGLLHMLTAVLKDDRELLMQSDDEEEDQRDSSSEEGEEDEVEAIEVSERFEL
jgi:hypothetical protein